MQRVLTYIFFLLLAVPFLVPLAGQYADCSACFQGWNTAPLKGYYVPGKALPLTWQTWLGAGDSSFQEQRAKVLTDSLRLRPMLVRLNNQLKFELFDEVNAKGIYLGKEGYFFEENNVKAYLGDAFMGEDTIRDKMQKLKVISDGLKTKGIQFLFVLAPGKASFMPENIPDRFAKIPQTTNNATIYRKYLNQFEIPLIDFSLHFQAMRDTASYPLYTKGGFHWSGYGVWLATDSLVKRLEQLTGRDMVDYQLVRLERPVIPRGTDNDIGAAANLLKEQFTDTLAYPVLKVFKEDTTRFRPRVLTIADSYNWSLMGSYVPHRFYAEGWRFWYYNQAIWRLNAMEDYAVPAIEDYEAALMKWDVILFIITEDNLYDGCWGFIERSYELFKK